MNSSVSVTLESHGETATSIGVLFWVLGFFLVDQSMKV